MLLLLSLTNLWSRLCCLSIHADYILKSQTGTSSIPLNTFLSIRMQEMHEIATISTDKALPIFKTRLLLYLISNVNEITTVDIATGQNNLFLLKYHIFLICFLHMYFFVCMLILCSSGKEVYALLLLVPNRVLCTCQLS